MKEFAPRDVSVGESENILVITEVQPLRTSHRERGTRCHG